MAYTYTRTFSLLEISPAAYKEITERIRALGPDYSEMFVERNSGAPNEQVVIDMHGVALATKCDHDWGGRNPDNAGSMYCVRCGARLR